MAQRVMWGIGLEKLEWIINSNLGLDSCVTVVSPKVGPVWGRYTPGKEKIIIEMDYWWMNDLYVCLMGRDRSRTAATIFGGDYAGVSDKADKKITSNQVKSADKIYVMNSWIKSEVSRMFPEESKGKKVVDMNVNGPGSYMDDDLAAALRLGKYGVETTY